MFTDPVKQINLLNQYCEELLIATFIKVTKNKNEATDKIFHLQSPPAPPPPSLKRGGKRTALIPLEGVPICAISSLGTTLMYCDHIRIFPACRRCHTPGLLPPPTAGRFRNTASQVRDCTPAIIPMLRRNRYLAPVCASLKGLRCRTCRVNVVIYCFLIYRNAAAGTK